jgi:predicted enzyme related to lactoylglutathione lyase
MVVRSRYVEGEPCWADAATPDMDTARRFYGAVLGWTFRATRPESGDHVLCLKDDQPVAALTRPLPGTGGPPAWTTYLKTSDAGAAAERVGPAGGELVTAPTDTANGGRTLLAKDPGGAVFGLWEARGAIGARLYGEPGAITWAEVSTRDPAAVDAFYRGLFGIDPVGWHDIPEQFPGDAPPEQTGMDYVVYNGADGEPMLSGRLALPANFGDVPPQWTLYVNVEDADVAADRVTAAGGSVVVPPFDTPFGRITLVADPHGAVLGLSAAAIARSRLASWAQS